MDTLLRDAQEKKLKLKNHLSCLMEELKDTRVRLAMQEERVELEKQSKEEAETKAKRLEEEVGILHALLQEKDEQLQSVTSSNAQRSAPTKATMEVLSTVDARNITHFEKDLFVLLLAKFEKFHHTLKAKERELTTLRKKFRMLSAYWRFKIKDLETKLEVNKDLDMGLKKKVLKLEILVHQSQSQLLALQKIEAKRDETIKELARSVTGEQYNKGWNFIQVGDIWNASCTRFALSISVTAILLFILSGK